MTQTIGKHAIIVRRQGKQAESSFFKERK